METIIDQLAKIEKEAIATIEATKRKQQELAKAHKARMEEYDAEAEAIKQKQLVVMKDELRKKLESEKESERDQASKELELLIEYYERNMEERVKEIIDEMRL